MFMAGLFAFHLVSFILLTRYTAISSAGESFYIFNHNEAVFYLQDFNFCVSDA
jgi:hypothetical protein